jgi:hypothetical protein
MSLVACAVGLAFVRPQENGNRLHARNLTLTAAAGHRLAAHTVAYALGFSA